MKSSIFQPIAILSFLAFPALAIGSECPAFHFPSKLDGSRCIPYNFLPDDLREAALSVCSDYKEFLEAHPTTLTRGEFETSEDYRRRQTDYEKGRRYAVEEFRDSLASSIWHLDVRALLHTYDADREQATIEFSLNSPSSRFKILPLEPDKDYRFSAPTSASLARRLREHEASLKLTADVQFKVNESSTRDGKCTLTMYLSDVELYSSKDNTVKHSGPWREW